jgi:hypothetical protein
MGTVKAEAAVKVGFTAVFPEDSDDFKAFSIEDGTRS